MLLKKNKISFRRKYLNDPKISEETKKLSTILDKIMYSKNIEEMQNIFKDYESYYKELIEIAKKW